MHDITENYLFYVRGQEKIKLWYSQDAFNCVGW